MSEGEIIDYIPLTLNATFFRPQPTTGEVQLTYSGNYFEGSFGIAENTLEIIWFYKEKGTEEWIEGGTLTPEINQNKIIEKTISLGETYDYQQEYEFQIIAKDKLTEASRTATVSIGIPIFNWGKNFFNVNVDLHLLGKNIFSLIYPVGSIYFSVNNINPSKLFGGEWIAWGNGKVPIGVDTSQTEFDTVEKTGGNKMHSHYQTIGANENDIYGIHSSDFEDSTSLTGYPLSIANNDVYVESHSSIIVNRTLTESSLQPYITCYMWKRVA